jgi:hypothetical protein
MAVMVREKISGSGIWWVFIHHDGKRRSKKIGDKKKALELAERIDIKLKSLKYEKQPSKTNLENIHFRTVPVKKLYMSGIYFIQRGYKGSIKIGITRTSIYTRLSQIQTGNDEKLRLVGFIECDNLESMESDLHYQFGEYRLQGEWFKPCSAIENFLKLSCV